MTTYRWSIFRARLGKAVGSEQRGTRPVLVISTDAYNYVMPLVTVLPITTRKPGRNVYRNEAVIPAGEGGIAKESLILAHQIRTLSKDRLGVRVGTITSVEVRSAVLTALRCHLEL